MLVSNLQPAAAIVMNEDKLKPCGETLSFADDSRAATFNVIIECYNCIQ